MRKTKTLDCAEIKRQAQQSLHAEYERRKGEFGSLLEFLNAKAEEAAVILGLPPHPRGDSSGTGRSEKG